MKVAVFYLSLTHGVGRIRIPVQGHGFVYVRAELAPKTQDLMEALDAAKPQPGETVMNSHYVEE